MRIAADSKFWFPNEYMGCVAAECKASEWWTKAHEWITGASLYPQTMHISCGASCVTRVTVSHFGCFSNGCCVIVVYVCMYATHVVSCAVTWSIVPVLSAFGCKQRIKLLLSRSLPPHFTLSHRLIFEYCGWKAECSKSIYRTSVPHSFAIAPDKWQKFSLFMWFFLLLLCVAWNTKSKLEHFVIIVKRENVWMEEAQVHVCVCSLEDRSPASLSWPFARPLFVVGQS